MLRFRLAPDNLKLGFMKLRRFSYSLSALLSILSVVGFLTLGLNYGIDFAGGTLMELRAKSGPAQLAELRSLGDKLQLGEVEVQAFGGDTDVTLRIRLQPGGDAAQQGEYRHRRDHEHGRDPLVIGKSDGDGDQQRNHRGHQREVAPARAMPFGSDLFTKQRRDRHVVHPAERP